MNRLTFAILGLVLLGAPLIAFIWQTLNVLLSGTIEPRRLALSLPALVLLYLLLRFVGRFVRRLDGAPTPSGEETAP